jgi:hypothetical protein
VSVRLFKTNKFDVFVMQQLLDFREIHCGPRSTAKAAGGARPSSYFGSLGASLQRIRASVICETPVPELVRNEMCSQALTSASAQNRSKKRVNDLTTYRLAKIKFVAAKRSPAWAAALSSALAVGGVSAARLPSDLGLSQLSATSMKLSDH